MAARIFKNAQVTIDGVDLSAFITEVTLNYNAEAQDGTTINTGTLSRISGLIDWSMDVTFNQEYGSGNVDDTIFSLIGGDPVTIVLLPRSGVAVSITNPSFTGSAIATTYSPGGGSVGQIEQTTVSFLSAGALVRATA